MKTSEYVEVIAGVCCTGLLTYLAIAARDWHIGATALICAILTALIWHRVLTTE